MVLQRGRPSRGDKTRKCAGAQAYIKTLQRGRPSRGDKTHL
ncbi:MAG: hypothetical protein H6R10_1468 [Rhodocyclaceae bacterium]|nr:hypothetical protein [Rhodocyclaceae bacterium]